MEATTGPNYIEISLSTPEEAPPTLSLSNVVTGHDWSGSDYYRSTLGDLEILGTFKTSDADQGTLEIIVEPNDSIYFRSGPHSGGQLLDNLNDELPPVALPVAEDWVLMTFKGPNIAAGEQRFRLSDASSEWGEWSAIAVNKN